MLGNLCKKGYIVMVLQSHSCIAFYNIQERGKEHERIRKNLKENLLLLHHPFLTKM
jgi:hypothetical protein